MTAAIVLSVFTLGFMVYYFGGHTPLLPAIAHRIGGGDFSREEPPADSSALRGNTPGLESEESPAPLTSQEPFTAGDALIAGGALTPRESLATGTPLTAGGTLTPRESLAPGTPLAAGEARVYLEKTLGFVTLGVIPLVASLVLFDDGLRSVGLAMPAGEYLLWWWLGPIALVGVIAAVRKADSINTDFYPQVRAREWPPRRIGRNAFFWMLYLVGYEFAFRGFLFFPLVGEFGLEGAIAVNCSLYALAHLYKGPGEAFGAFFLGILLCVIAAATGSFVIPLVVHVILALSNDYAAVAAHREMRFIR